MICSETTTTVMLARDAAGAYREPTIEEILSDTIVEAVMQADAVDPKELRAMFGKIAQARKLTAGADVTPPILP